jgi:hypothetical protein
MKSTKIMLAVIVTTLITWIVMGLIGWCVSDLSFRDCLTHSGTLMLMLLIGWIPAVFVGSDLSEHLNR